MLVWSSYISDLGRAYPMFTLSIQQINETSPTLDPLAQLPHSIRSLAIDIQFPCRVDQLTPRTLGLWLSDGGQYRVTYPQPFTQNLADYLNASVEVIAWEFIGERVRYGRLRRMLDNV